MKLIAAIFESNKGLSKKEMGAQLMNDLAIRFQFDLQEKAREERKVMQGALVLAFPGSSNMELSRAMHDLHRQGASFASRNWNSGRVPKVVKLTMLEPSLYFSYEPHNPILQLADIVSGCVSWSLKKREYHYFRRIKGAFRGCPRNR